MKRAFLTLFVAAWCAGAHAQSTADLHPDTSAPGWENVFAPDLTGAIYPEGVWTVEDGLLTASEDKVIWSARAYDEYVLDLEFRNAEGTNSGVFVHASDLEHPVPNSIEVQIADDYHEPWASAPASWQCGAIFGHQPARARAVKPPGEWNRYTITARDRTIRVVLNGVLVNEIDMDQWTSAEVNPDGSEIPEWLSTPLAELPDRGHIGLQGKHAGAPIWFRNIRIRVLE